MNICCLFSFSFTFSLLVIKESLQRPEKVIHACVVHVLYSIRYSIFLSLFYQYLTCVTEVIPRLFMASAAPTFPSTKETTNYARLCRLLVDVGTQVLRETFDKIHPPRGLQKVLGGPAVFSILQSLRKRKVLNPSQWGELYPAIKSAVSSKSFDITLLMVLLRNICGLTSPATGWDNFPLATDVSQEADIARVKMYRNTVYGHASQASVDDVTFGTCWKQIRDTLERLGGVTYGTAIDDLEHESMDPDIEKHYKELLKQWKMDEDNIKDKLDVLDKKLDEIKAGVSKWNK